MIDPTQSALQSELLRRSGARLAFDEQGRDPDGKFASGGGGGSPEFKRSMTHQEVAKAHGWQERDYNVPHWAKKGTAGSEKHAGSGYFEHPAHPGHLLNTANKGTMWGGRFGQPGSSTHPGEWNHLFAGSEGKTGGRTSGGGAESLHKHLTEFHSDPSGTKPKHAY